MYLKDAIWREAGWGGNGNVLGDVVVECYYLLRLSGARPNINENGPHIFFHNGCTAEI